MVKADPEAGSKRRSAGQAHGLVPTRIALLYESRDKRLCLFEDAHGHLTVVRASRLA